MFKKDRGRKINRLNKRESEFRQDSEPSKLTISCMTDIKTFSWHYKTFVEKKKIPQTS